MKSMRTNQHQLFIQTPILDILRETVTSCRAIGDGIETQPLCEYILQTTFLKMTGASEQKLKCICWEMATFDYEYRYKMLLSPMGECSCYDDKNMIFKSMQDVIIRLDAENISNKTIEKPYKQILANNIKNDITSIIDKSLISVMKEQEFQSFKGSKNIIQANLFANYGQGKISFLEKDLKDFYTSVVFRYRNRYAHNLKSYQENLPSLSGLKDGIYEKENYFTMLSILILMDELYMKLYGIYTNCLKEVKW